MVNSTLLKDVSNKLMIDERVEKIPPPIPIFEVYPSDRILSANGGSIVTSGSSTAILASSVSQGRRVFVHGLIFSITKDAACDTATGYASVTCTINGATSYLARIMHITLNAQNSQVVINFKRPIEVDPDSAISIQAISFTAGTFARTATLFYSLMN